MSFRFSALVSLIFFLSCGNSKPEIESKAKVPVRSEELAKGKQFSSPGEFQAYFKEINVGWTKVHLIEYAGQPAFKKGNVWSYFGPMPRGEGGMYYTYDITLIDNVIRKIVPNDSCILRTVRSE